MLALSTCNEIISTLGANARLVKILEDKIRAVFYIAVFSKSMRLMSDMSEVEILRPIYMFLELNVNIHINVYYK